MREVVIASSVRTAVGRAFKGTLRATRPDELGAIAIKGALERVPYLDPKEIEDVILGCAMRHGIDVDDPDGRAQDLAESVAGGSLSGRVSVDGVDRGEAGASLWHHARGGR